MRLVNETLSNLKAYARKEYYVTQNVPVLVMLITEEEHRLLQSCYLETTKEINEQGSRIRDISKESQATHYSEEFFPVVACTTRLIHTSSPEAFPIITTTLREAFDIPHFGKYKYTIMIREEQLLEWGRQMDIQVNSLQATGNTRKLMIFYRILTHEFLHVVEREKCIRIFTDNKSLDSEIVTRAFQSVKFSISADIFS
jgi:hypothetical protein